MKSKTNLFLFASLVIALILTGWLYYLSGKRVGDLAVDEQQDGDFQVCDEDKIFQYYNLDTDYKGGKKAIKKEILNELESLNFKNQGLVTARFIVNCNGDAGRFRYKSTDLDLKEMKVNSENIERIKSAVLLLQNWNSPKENKVFDSYYVLNFKIRNNKIVDIF
ncbi:hypothetical protein APR41_15180 [Salegentibacter salinarum]|uniref:TonB C-terminal domain-containing protein n=1 Tax=Salegentibacter salinarum TaxID=447422 RepID=A0A2N0TZ35_9FLAO|nr:hypothetical protein [Salegentibacter salinarum]PKD20012.1 hypothetical protein APR41_15180 [Salegentibacter salinarum]SKB97459.1 hypothetical protein SAMN05660903_03588 [Salegentibacter salinarum]